MSARGASVQFAVERVAVGGMPVVQVVGELDIATAPDLAGALDEELAGPAPTVVVDLTRATFLDSTGARTVAAAGKSAGRADTRLVVVCPRDNTAVRRVLDWLQIDAVVPVREQLSDVVG